jgi:hypothetical protein
MITEHKKNQYKQELNKFDYLPLILVASYIIFTYGLHIVINYPTSIKGLFFMTINVFSIFFGYLMPNKRFYRSNYAFKDQAINYKHIERIIFFCSIIVILYSYNIISSYYDSLSEIIEFATNPGKSYGYIKQLRKYPHLNEVDGGFNSTFSILLTLTVGTKYIYITLSLLYWKYINKITKVMAVAATLAYFLNSLLVGAMITIASLFLSSLPVLILFLRKKRNNNLDSGKVSSRGRRLKVILGMAFVSFLVIFFISNRVEGSANILTGIESLITYMSHGYVGLDYTLELPFEFTYGFTTFRAVGGYLVKYLGFQNYFLDSYLVRNELVTGWPALSVWSTFFPWVASDFTFYSIPFLLIIISNKFAAIWNKTIRTQNPYGYLILGQFFIFWFMIPANNQLFHTLENTSAFILIYYLYRRSLKQKNIKAKFNFSNKNI